jgi:hypothetical protein
LLRGENSDAHDHDARPQSHRLSLSARRSISEGKIVQEVHIIDADGVAWEALYTLEPQSDGSFKISACVLSKLITS